MNLPNKLTTVRMILTPFVLMLIYLEGFRIYALVLFAVAVITDYFDGWFAVHKNMKSRFGNFLDPVSDKILVLSCLILLASFELFPLWMVLVILAREFIMNGLRSSLSGTDMIVGANMGGKTKFSLQSLVIFLSILYLAFPQKLGQNFVLVLNAMLLLVVVITIITLFNFMIKNKKALKELIKN